MKPAPFGLTWRQVSIAYQVVVLLGALWAESSLLVAAGCLMAGHIAARLEREEAKK